MVSLANISLDRDQNVELNLQGMPSNGKSITGEILTCKNITDYNDFEHPQNILPKDFKGAKISKKALKVKIPAKSIVVLKIK